MNYDKNPYIPSFALSAIPFSDMERNATVEELRIFAKNVLRLHPE
jgi:hypothetical protein